MLENHLKIHKYDQTFLTGFTLLVCLTQFVSPAASDELLCASLPQSPAELSDLGRRLAQLQRGLHATEPKLHPAGPRVRNVPSLALPPQGARESRPLFVLPPLGVLDAASECQLATLASAMHCAVMVVEAPPGASVQETAAAIVQVSDLSNCASIPEKKIIGNEFGASLYKDCTFV